MTENLNVLPTSDSRVKRRQTRFKLLWRPVRVFFSSPFPTIRLLNVVIFVVVVVVVVVNRFSYIKNAMYFAAMCLR